MTKTNKQLSYWSKRITKAINEYMAANDPKEKEKIINYILSIYKIITRDFDCRLVKNTKTLQYEFISNKNEG